MPRIASANVRSGGASEQGTEVERRRVRVRGQRDVPASERVFTSPQNGADQTERLCELGRVETLKHTRPGRFFERVEGNLHL